MNHYIEIIGVDGISQYYDYDHFDDVIIDKTGSYFIFKILITSKETSLEVENKLFSYFMADSNTKGKDKILTSKENITKLVWEVSFEKSLEVENRLYTYYMADANTKGKGKILQVECFKTKTYILEIKNEVYKQKHAYNKRNHKNVYIRLIEKKKEKKVNTDEKALKLKEAHLMWEISKEYTNTKSKKEQKLRRNNFVLALKEFEAKC